ncbi:Protein phosphatase 2C family protein [Perilla frutescens var. frutescens]|nr:Protein phosphatase 2C family protein [Perilla frutescens var. frutescens]
MESREERHKHHDLVPLAALINRELRNEKMEKPAVRYGSAAQSRKGEDYFLMKTDCQRVPGNPSTSFAVFGLSSTGGRLIIASDGIWDAVSSETAAKACRGLPAELAARLVVKEALRTRGLKDDTTCIVVDIIPPDNKPPPSPPPKKYNKLKALFFRKNSGKSTNKLAKKLSAVGIVEELFEEGSAMLAERLGNDEPSAQTSGLFMCAVCQADLAPNEGISVHAGSIFSASSTPWQGPFLCGDCRNKKDAMEGKRPSGIKVV